MEARFKVEKEVREQRKKEKTFDQSGFSKGKEKRKRSEGVSIASTLDGQADPTGARQQAQTVPTCSICGNKHWKKCKAGSGVCFRCGQPDHFVKDCPQQGGQPAPTATTQPNVQENRNEPRGRGRGQAPAQAARTEPMRPPPPAGRGRAIAGILVIQNIPA